jgi:hypothetical protein
MCQLSDIVSYFGDRILVEVRFSTPVQSCCGAHPASCTVGAGSLARVKQLGHGVHNLPDLVLRFKKE